MHMHQNYRANTPLHVSKNQNNIKYPRKRLKRENPIQFAPHRLKKKIYIYIHQTGNKLQMGIPNYTVPTNIKFKLNPKKMHNLNEMIKWVYRIHT